MSKIKIKKKKQKATGLSERVTVRVKKGMSEELEQLGIDVPEVCREALAKAVLDSTGKCPTCGRYEK